jgi:hypothetical protein
MIYVHRATIRRIAAFIVVVCTIVLFVVVEVESDENGGKKIWR